jgi:GT2 family glycosyltransferase
MHVALARTLSRPDVFFGSLRGTNRIGWHLIVLRARRQPLGWTATIRVSCEDAARTQDIQLVHPLARQVLGVKLGVLFLGDRATEFRVRLHNALDPPEAVGLTLLSIPPFLAAVGICLQNPTAFRDAFRSVSGSWAARVRKGVAAAAFEGQRIKGDYRLWTWFFDAWSEGRLQRIAAALPARPSVGALVFCATRNEAALAATLASVRAQTYAAAALVVVRPGEAGAISSASASEYVAVLQAGEVLPRHALLLLVDELGRQGADALLADEDRIGPDGTRADPWFKPQPSLTMMCSGLLSRGVWLVRSSVLRQALASAAVPDWAECIRLAVWFTLHAAGGPTGRTVGEVARVRRVPRVLTHRRADAEAAPPAVLAQVVDMFLGRQGVQATVTPEFPLRLRWHGGGPATRKVSLIVPSRLRGDVQLRCLLDVLANTTYRDFEMLVVVTQDGPLDKVQHRAAERLRAAGPARVELLRRASFNYSLASNLGASLTDGALICLLNDDVSTLDGDWLDRMVAVFSDKGVGIVGAKLYYPNMTTQHGGVIMGLAGLAEHVNRFLPQGEPGYMWRGVLDQELSVVTGACLLVRRDVFKQVGGLDEALPTGFNDVDFCLRVRALRYSVVMAASVELVHHETLSFGHHYANANEREAADVALMLERWQAVCAADPFHNPNLSLAARNEWTLASPPRVSLDEPYHGRPA